MLLQIGMQICIPEEISLEGPVSFSILGEEGEGRRRVGPTVSGKSAMSTSSLPPH